MFHQDAVPQALHSLLGKVLSIEGLENFFLGGGTSLAYRLGYRSSIDIDLFCDSVFDTQACLDALESVFPGFALLNRTKGSLCVAIDGIKADFLLHQYPILAKAEEPYGIRMLSLEDVAAMKVNAVTNRGSKKDFSDLLALSEKGFPLGRCVDLFCQKYGSAGKFLAIRSLSYFDDAAEEPDPTYLRGWTWPEVKRRMTGLAKELASG
jgi:hypothetical protein